VMNIPILNGRNFTDADDANAQPIALVSESFAHKYWPGEDAVGKYIFILRDNSSVVSKGLVPKGMVHDNSVQDSSVPRRIVGVVRDVRSVIEEEPPPTMYVSYKQMSFPSMAIVLLSRDRSGSALAKIRQAVQSVDPEQPVEYVDSMESIVREELQPWRFALALVGGLAGLAIVITGVGLFAVVSYLVRERTKELGLRMAMGARRSNVMKLVLGQSLKLALVGTGIGLALTYTAVHLMASMMYAIHPNDPATLVVVALLVAAISMLAAYVPARRAARIEPLAALREQ
jgi:putative ABC transport system permease protein